MTDLADELANAPTVPPHKSGGDPPAPPPERPDRVRGEIWPGCPVTPLGVYGPVSYYLDVNGQLRNVTKHDRQNMLHLFGGRIGLLSGKYPRFNKDGVPIANAFEETKLASHMMAACSDLGVWSPTFRMRGPGCWRDDDTGALIMHAGNAVLIDGQWREPGVYGGKVYAASDPTPRPTSKPARRDPADELLNDLETWNWRRPDIDPFLVLGSIVAQMVGGALEWRPVVWITGDAATGKSTLQNLLLYVHGGNAGLLQAADATEGGIRAVVGYSSLPVAIDELEPDADNPRKVKAVVELARKAASGAQIMRGSADQKGHQQNAFSCFLFSSILVPPMPPQDRSRLVLLDLDRLKKDAPKMNIDRRRLANIGAHLRRAVLIGWGTYEDRLQLFRAALAEAGHTGRSADNYGTVLTLADLVRNPEALPDRATLDGWAKKLSHAVTEESMEVGSNADDMLTHLLSQTLDPWRRGQQHTVASWIQVAAAIDGAPEIAEIADHKAANRILIDYGLRVRGRQKDAVLCIATLQFQKLLDLFERTMWAEGAWSQAARRLQGAQLTTIAACGKSSVRAWAVPLKSIPGLFSLPADGRVAAGDPLDEDAADFL